MDKRNKYLFPLILITVLFFLWGFAHNLNPILIPHLKKACQLNDLESSLIDSAFFIAYFLMALPAGYFMKKYGYKGGIILGLILFATGAFLFYPAASLRDFGFFLFALFVIASGLTFLETAANPYMNELGDPATATQRLNFAQSFNGLAATLAPLIGGNLILSGKTLTEAEKAQMTAGQLDAYLNVEASAVKVPYLVIGIIVLLVAILLWRAKLPEIVEEEDSALEVKGSIFKERNLVFGVVALFFYVGAQVGIASFFIRYSHYVAGIEEKTAAYLLSAALFGFMIGRFVGTFLMKYIAPHVLLAVYSIISVVLLFVVVLATGQAGIYALVGIQFFMSIMFPTIFSLGIRGLGTKRKQGSSLLIMAIVGGAILPVIMGRVSDANEGNIQLAYIVPVICFVIIFFFALYQTRVKAEMEKVQISH
ncbi:L-fucose:H+ symporter permease [Desertivirga xinjiangensis]|uniref:L-fucose:H+ symporter permease n=1 Tax=Desertivirga xinjiangensis TaxID=539206 RepID=UPI00210CA9CF|nr:L-fucose:H+ symporter permease [Pedobacter xinjiangensis]